MNESSRSSMTERETAAVVDPAETEALDVEDRPPAIAVEETVGFGDDHPTELEGSQETVLVDGSSGSRGFCLLSGHAHASGNGSFEEQDQDQEPAPTVGRSSARSRCQSIPYAIGRYRVERRLGLGTFGVVYLANDDMAHRQVAIKVPHRVSRPIHLPFESDYHELRILARLDHKAIVPVYDGGLLEDGRCYIVSKFIDGNSLKDRLRSRRPGFEVVAEWIAWAAEGLQSAHDVGVIHRDIKPANLLIDAAGNLYVGDFGTALEEGEQESVRGFAGTPAYTSPEQARGEGHRVDARSDIFSLGIVLYEALTGVKPFECDSVTTTLRNVAALAARPPRVVDPSIPEELERICLTAMAKRSDDRYETARAMAADLRHWLVEARAPLTSIQGPEPARPRSIVPRGLRPFEEADAAFFLDLLPGPRGRDNLPESLRFWKDRIEREDGPEPFSVGVLYGPSGGGKSSFVRAGLIPRLNDRVRTIYVEATAEETEARLSRGLRRAFPQLEARADADLARLLRSLRNGRGLARDKKVLIVIDQFEQWLFGRHGDQRRVLENALRQCDGARVQALLVVRDEFWMDLIRLAQALEVRLTDGANTAAVDLFDLDHARKVLIILGQAHGRLPLDRGEFTPEHEAFLDDALKGLSRDGRVVCVRLVLFADRLRAKPWTRSTLRALGGVGAIGVSALDEAFSAPRAAPQNRLRREAARAVLERLLPEPGVAIKGHMVARDRLMEAASLEGSRSREFDELIQILDHQLHLVTPADPRGRTGVDDSTVDDGEPACYQLTHDYLIPELREWLLRDQQQTIHGRAALQLREFAAVWSGSDRKQAKFLPTSWEWLSLMLLTSPSRRSSAEQAMLRAAATRHARAAFVLVVILSALGWLGAQKFGEFQARSLVKTLKSAETDQVLRIASEIQTYRRWAFPILREELNLPAPDRRVSTVARIALLPEDPRQVDPLLEAMIDGSTTLDRSLMIRDALFPYRSQITPRLWELAHDARRPENDRFRAALALAKYDPPRSAPGADADATAWDDGLAGLIVNRLLTALDANPSDYTRLVAAVAPIRWVLLPKLAAASHDLGQERLSMATSLVADLARDDSQVIGDFVLDADPAQFARLFPLVVSHRGLLISGFQEIAGRPVEGTTEQEKDRLAHRRALAAICLLRLGEEGGGEAWSIFRSEADPRARTIMIHEAKDYGVDLGLLVKRLAVEDDPSKLRGLLLAVGRHGALKSQAERARAREVIDLAGARFLAHPDPGVKGAAEWVVRQIEPGTEPLAAKRCRTSPREAGLGGWYVTKNGHVMVIIDARSDPEVGKVFAIAAKETTIEQVSRLKDKYWFNREITPDPRNTPAHFLDWRESKEYCDKLTVDEGLCDEAIASEDLAEAELGYRLPTFAEWKHACRAGTTTRTYYGTREDLMSCYGWAGFMEKLQAVGSLMPNDFGLFDMYGNVAEWTADVVNGGQEVRTAGGVLRIPYSRIHSSAYLDVKADLKYNSFGIRVARTIELDAEGRPK